MACAISMIPLNEVIKLDKGTPNATLFLQRGVRLFFYEQLYDVSGNNYS